MDQCTHCTVRGDMEQCLKTTCNIHESWHVQQLSAEVERLRNGLTIISCEPINAEFMAENILNGKQAYHETMIQPTTEGEEG